MVIEWWALDDGHWVIYFLVIAIGYWVMGDVSWCWVLGAGYWVLGDVYW